MTASNVTERRSFCRFCPAFCSVRVEVEDTTAVRVIGDPENPVYGGYTCPKGRQLPEWHNRPDRLLQSLERTATGEHVAISSAQAVTEIAARLREIVERDGPRAVALYRGNAAGGNATSVAVGASLMKALGSPMLFSAATIDQPAKVVSGALTGRWQGGLHGFDESDVCFIVGANPLVSMWGAEFAFYNPWRRLADARRRGLKLIVADPRRTETAARADLHLQIRPGEDPAMLAGIIREILADQLFDAAFVAENVRGVDALRAAVQPFTVEHVAQRTGVSGEALREAVRMFATASRGVMSAGTGPDMAPHGNLTEYLIAAINFLCGRVRREGDMVYNPPVLTAPQDRRAQATGPRPVDGFGEQLRSRPLGMSVVGMPTAALPDEILHPDGGVRALIVNSGNPAVAWPDQLKAVAALEHLELLVTITPDMSATARLSDYVIAPKLSLEVPAVTLLHEETMPEYPAMSHIQPHAQYTPAVISPPAGSDVLEEWEFFYRLGRQMDLELEVRGHALPADPPPTSDELLELICAGSRVPLSAVKRFPGGGLFPDPEARVLPRTPDAALLDLGNALMLEELGIVRAAWSDDAAEASPYTHMLTVRRLRNVNNSSAHGLSAQRRFGSYNPAYLHPDDCRQLQVETGDLITITSARSSILGVVEEADDVLPGVVSMPHNWGGIPGEQQDVRAVGSTTGRLISNEEITDRWVGMPRMSAIPVFLRRGGGPAAD